MVVGTWIYGRWSGPERSTPVRLIACLLTALLVIGGLGWGARMARTASASAARADGISWEPYSPQRLAELRQAGKPVFVDFSAAWCLSCKANELFTLDKKETARAFRKHGIATLKADWTRQDATITRALAGFGRSGVPLYVLYGRDPAKPPQVLPEVITPQIVLDAIAQMP
jgi:thiol:disulfide interchange protein DsbD